MTLFHLHRILAASLLFFASTTNVVVVDATFSIAATDKDSQQVGAAGASCTPSSVLEGLYQGVPGKGVLIAQALAPAADSVIYTTARSLLQSDAPPSQITERITDPTLDDTTTTVATPVDWEATAATNYETIVYRPDAVEYMDYTLRQYGVVDLKNSPAGYTGLNIQPYYYDMGLSEAALGVNYTQKHFAGRSNQLTYSAQGSGVTETTVSLLVDTLLQPPTVACDLADRLYQSIVRPFQQYSSFNQIGDVMCFEENSAPASGIFLHVDAPDGSEVVSIDIVSDEIGGQSVNPFVAFSQAYNAWRAVNPCPGAPTAAPLDGDRDIFAETEAPTSSSGSLESMGVAQWALVSAVVVFPELVLAL